MTRDEIRKKWKNGEFINQKQEEQPTQTTEQKKQEPTTTNNVSTGQTSMWGKVLDKLGEHMDKASGGHIQEKFGKRQPTMAEKIAPKNDSASLRYNRYGVGNIDLQNRKVVKNKDGSISTEKSFSFYDDKEKKEILVPTIIDGKEVSEKEAEEHYYKTGEYLGKFDTPEQADEYAEGLHEKQEKRYGEKQGLLQGWVDTGAFNDGYQFGDLTKTEIATSLDLTKRIFKGGITNASKAISDLAVITSAAYKRYVNGDEEGADRLLNTAYQNSDLSEKVADGILGGAGTIVKYFSPAEQRELMLEIGKSVLQGENPVDSAKNKLLGDFNEMSDMFKNVEEDSLLGNKGGQLTESVTQNARQKFLQTQLKIPWQVQMAIETAPESYLQKKVGEQMSEGKSVLSTIADVGNEILWESVFDGIEFKGTGGTTIDNFLNGKINTISNPATRAITKNFKRVLGEGFEEAGGDYTGNLKDFIIREFPEGEEMTKENLINFLKDLPANAVLNLMETTEDKQTWEDFLMGSLSVVGQDAASMGRPVVNQFNQERYVQPVIENQNLNQKEKNTIIEAMTGEAPENVKKNQKESEKIAETIENSNLTDEEKNAIAREITNNGYNLNSYRETVLNRLISKNQSTTIENEPVSEQEQQTILEQPRLPEKATSQEIEEKPRNIGVHYGDLGKGRDTTYNAQQERKGRNITGGFGTGTYFFSEQASNNISESDKFHIEGRPKNEIDLSDYNLYKPESNEEAQKLYDALESANNFEFENINEDEINNLKEFIENSREDFIKGKLDTQKILNYFNENGIHILIILFPCWGFQKYC